MIGPLVLFIVLSQSSPVVASEPRADSVDRTLGRILVLNEAGLPVSHARVAVAKQEFDESRFVAKPDVTGTTGIEGPLEEGRYEIRVNVGERRESARLEVAPDTQVVGLRIRLKKGAGIDVEMTSTTICIARPATSLLDLFGAPPN